MKRATSSIVAWVWLCSEAASASPWRVRLTETSVTERGRVVADDAKLQTKGYGLGLVTPSGFGAALTSLTTRGSDATEGGTETVELRHQYLDGSFTYGETYLVTGGIGIALGRAASIRGEESKAVSGTSLFIGPGYAFGWFEVYWIYRQNRLRYKFDTGNARIASLQHFQLGLGVNF